MLKIFNRPLKPTREGYLPEEDGHKIYYAMYGNPKGQTILSFHGGPGYFSNPPSKKRFNLKKYNVIVFDQRGCGKSKPEGRLEHNTTDKLLSDAQRILEIFNTKKVILNGNSWGSTLALLFAEKSPKMVTKIIITNVCLSRTEDLVWAFESTKYLYPDMYEDMIKHKPKNISLFDYYYKLITSDKLSDRKKGMAVTNYEFILDDLDPKKQDYTGEEYHNYGKVFLHYMINDSFIEDNQIIHNIKNIQNKPCLIVHNRLDIGCPLSAPYELSKLMKKAKFVINPAIGHGCELMKNLSNDITEFLDA